MSEHTYTMAELIPLQERINHMLREAARLGIRGLMHISTPGGRHIDRIVRDSLARRLPAEQTAIRLIAAADLADVLDGGTR